MSGGGSKPGERRGGRQKGVPNKATRDIRALAQKYGPEAIRKLAKLMRDSESEQVQAMAADKLLDRAYGKATQPIEHELDLSNLTDEQIIALASALGAASALGQGVGRDRAQATTH